MSPTVRAWELGIRLRERREQLGLTATAAARRAGCTQAYLSGVESGRVKITEEKLAEVLASYDVDQHECHELQRLRTEATQRGWWHQYAKLLGVEMTRFLGFEAGATSVRAYNADVIYGPFQTEDYARAMVLSSAPHIRLTEVDRRVQSRLTRRDRVFGADPLQVTCVLGQAALMQQVGGLGVMRAQLDHLVTIAREHANHIEIRVIPFTAGAYSAIGGSFQILSFASEHLPDLVYQELLTSRGIVDESYEVVDYVVGFAESAEKALAPEASLDLVRQIAKEMR